MKYLGCFKRLSEGLEMDEFGKAFVLLTGFYGEQKEKGDRENAMTNDPILAVRSLPKGHDGNSS